MGRLGFAPDGAAWALSELAHMNHVVQPVGLMTHMACADEPDHPLNQKQIDNFAALIQGHAGPKSLCNSASIFAFPDQHHDWVRPGLALYGASPFAGGHATDLGLKPVMTLRTKLTSMNDMNRGDTVGYGARFTCPEDMKIGVMAIGYGDGYPRDLANGTPVLVNGKLCALAGRVSMDMATVDLRNAPDAKPGDDVVLWGEGLPVEQVASGTPHIAYDILTGVRGRVPFHWD